MSFVDCRYTLKPPTFQQCDHKTKSKALKCSELSEADILRLNSAFYSNKEKRGQDAFILKHVSVNDCIRRKTTSEKKKVSLHYFIRKDKICVRVCRKKFLATLSVGRSRVESIVTHYHRTGQVNIINNIFHKL